ncbi:MAG: chitobiase/beta-hexosaminidase C-terminal domain-containing protein, partial [Prevotella sp.]|nr:chitobiase/beta-hexosaminidase C-terminal domain-containing protein [Prevotella sp.]
MTISEPNGTATTVKAIAQIAGFDVSEITTATFTSSQPLADTPVINNADGQDKFWPTTTVTITSAQEGAVIYYTTDGSAPTTASTRYTGPITLSNTAVVKAIAVVNGYANSVVAEKSFMLSDPALEPRTVTHMFNDQSIYGSQPA